MSPERPYLLTEVQLAKVVERLGRAISRDHPDGVVLVGVLKGSVCLLADLLREVHVACEVDFLSLSAYSGGPTRVQVLKDLDIDVKGRDVVLVEDVVDTGLSARYVLDLIARHGARRVRLCALLDRPGRRIIPLEVDYLGLAAPDDFLVGYGLDLAERYRNVPGLVVLSPDEVVMLSSEARGDVGGDRGSAVGERHLVGGPDASRADLERSLYGAP